MSTSISREQLSQELLASMGFEADVVTYGSAPAEEQIYAVQLNTLTGVREMILQYHSMISLPVLHWAAEKAYRFAVSKAPVPVPQSVIDWGWNMLEHSITQLYHQSVAGS